jgi:acetyl esterase/lipase
MGLQNKKLAIKKLKNLVYSPKDSVEFFRKNFESTLYTPFLPNRVEYESANIGGIDCDILKPEIYSKDRVILYIHGGCFIGGSRKSYRGFCSSLAYASNSKIIIPEIRLAPSHPYPAALEDVKKVLQVIYAEKPQIIIAADGSGASIALALAFSLKGKFRIKLQQIVLFSPWLDISADSEVLKFPPKKNKDKIITPEALRCCAELYTYGSNQNQPYISPMYATNEMLTNLPEIYIQMGQDELLSHDVVFFENKLKKAHVPCTIDIWKKMIYMFQMADEYIEESHLAIEAVGKHIKDTEMPDLFRPIGEISWN